MFFCQKELLGFELQVGTDLSKDSCRKPVLVSYNRLLHCRYSAAGAAVLAAEAFYGLVF